ncbi:hypothetical protein TNCV_5119051 [Trichonephila clavipes]|nr:hypothetical protein TNCV_5119051 [Trichonephila clavipes]
MQPVVRGLGGHRLGKWLRMLRAMEKGSRIVNWRIHRSERSDVHLCAPLPLQDTRRPCERHPPEVAPSPSCLPKGVGGNKA